MRLSLLAWLNEKLANAERAVLAREQAEQCWRGGTSESWRKVGCRLTKAQRLEQADKDHRIGKKCCIDIETYRALIEIVAKGEQQ